MIVEPAWRNWIARWTSNPKVVGSNPAVGLCFCYIIIKVNGYYNADNGW